MTHEPECDYAGVMTIGMPCRQCAAIRIAYQRGREDERNEHCIQGEGQVPFVARGDGEQA